MCRRALASLVVAISLVGAVVAADDDDEITGITGELTLVVKNKENAGVVDKMKVHVDDEVEIIWSYPIIPAAIPKKVSGKSSSDCMKLDDIVRIKRADVVGAAAVSAFFTAKKPGTATLKFEITDGGEGATLQCQVEVVE